MVTWFGTRALGGVVGSPVLGLGCRLDVVLGWSLGSVLGCVLRMFLGCSLGSRLGCVLCVLLGWSLGLGLVTDGVGLG